MNRKRREKIKDNGRCASLDRKKRKGPSQGKGGGAQLPIRGRQKENGKGKMALTVRVRPGAA